MTQRQRIAQLEEKLEVLESGRVVKEKYDLSLHLFCHLLC